MIWNGLSIYYGIFFDGESISGLRLGWDWIEKVKITLISNDTVELIITYIATYMLIRGEHLQATYRPNYGYLEAEKRNR